MADINGNDENKKETAAPSPWIPDTRTVIVSWMMVSSFLVIFLFWLKPPKPEDSQLLNTLVGIYFGTGLVTAIQWWMGSSKGSDANNKMAEDNSRMVDKLTSAAVQPQTAPSVPIPPWWSRFTEDEKNAITAAGKTDPRVDSIVTASTAGAATPSDLDYLVSKNLLTAARAGEIKAG